MHNQPGSNAYFNVPEAYDDYMGRFSKQLSPEFVRSIPLEAGDRVLDLGCGPGALTGYLVDLLGAEAVTVLDPSPPFLEACVRRFPGVTGKVGAAENIPFEDGSFDAVMSQLVIHFFVDLERAGQEMIRVTKPGGWIAACTWMVEQMELLHLFDVAAIEATGAAPPSPPAQEFRAEGAITAYFTSLGLTEVSESGIGVSCTYASFNELWGVYLAGIGPLGAWLQSQSAEAKADIKRAAFRLLGDPAGEVTLSALARSGRGRTPA